MTNRVTIVVSAMSSFAQPPSARSPWSWIPTLYFAQGVPYVKGVADFVQNARGVMIGETGHLKLLFHRDTMKLLGVHCIGEGATELVHVGLVNLLAGGGAELFIEACFNYPTLSEAYKYATYDALGRKERS